MMKRQLAYIIVMLSLVILFAGCTAVTLSPSATSIGSGAITAPEAKVDKANLVATLGNLSYPGLFDDKIVNLIDGTYVYTEVGVPAKPIVRLVDRLAVQGDLNGDGVEDAVAVLENDTPGTGRFAFISPVLNIVEAPTPGQPFLLGDRIQLKSLELADGKVVVEYLAQGAGDGECCPTWNTRSVYGLQGDTFTEESTEQLSKVSFADMDGTTWRLVDLSEGNQPVLPDTEVTLHIEGDQISGSGGCNNYNATVATAVDAPQTLSVGPIASTMMACPEEIAKQEATYFARLQKAVLWGYQDGMFGIAYELEDNSAGHMLFELMPTENSSTEGNAMTETSSDAATEGISTEDRALFDAVAASDKSMQRIAEGCIDSLIPGGRVYPLAEPGYNAKRPLALDAFADALAGYSPERATELDSDLKGKDITQIQTLLDEGKLSSVDLVTYYVDRIRRYDVDKLNSVLELNPDALAIAAMLDAERAAGAVRGPLHGIPVLLKDNIATGDQMHTTAGAYALKDWHADRDAYLVKKLRDAGAIILGKANLSEWANYMDPCMPSGFSVIGGQTRNPYGPYDTLGSSSGSAVSVGADLTTVSVGSETSGSLVQPARVNGVVGMRPSQGLVSRDHVIPLGPDLDTAGPMGRSVADVAALLTVLAGTDANDAKTADAAALDGVDFTQYLSMDEARKLRVGVIVPRAGAAALLDGKAQMIEAISGQKLSDADKQALLAEDVFPSIGGDPAVAIEALKQAGIEYVEIDDTTLPPSADTAQALLQYSFNAGIADFFGRLAQPAPIKSLSDVVAINNEDPANRAPYGQYFVERSAANTTTPEDYARIRGVAQTLARNWMKTVLADNSVDVLVSGMSYASNAGAAGVPAITIPAGLDPKGQPQGIVLSGDYLSDPKLLAVAYALEQTLQGRVEPNLDETIAEIEAVTKK